MSEGDDPFDDASDVRVFGPDSGGDPWTKLEKATSTQQVHTDDDSHTGAPEYHDPPFDPDQLAELLERSETHAACVDAKARAVAGHGFELTPHEADSDSDSEPPGRETVEDFWFGPGSTFQLGPDAQPATPTDVLEHGWRDYESIYWASYELLVNQNTGEPTGLAHVPAHTVRDRKDAPGFVQIDEGRPVRFFGAAGGRYGDDKTFVDAESGETASTAGGVDSVANELLVIRNYSATSPHYGTPDIIPAMPAVTTQQAIQNWNHTFFENDGTPRTAIMVTEGELTDRAWDDIKQTFKDLKDPENSHRSVILEAESIASEQGAQIEIEQISVGVNEEGDFLELMQENEHQILKAHNVPPVLVGRTENVNFASGKSQRVEFAQSTARPRQDRLAARLYNVIHRVALGVEGWTLDFNLYGGSNQLRESEIAANRVDAGVKAGMTVNEARDELDLPPLDGPEGEQLLSQLGGGTSAVQSAVEGEREAARQDERARTQGYSVVGRAGTD